MTPHHKPLFHLSTPAAGLVEGLDGAQRPGALLQEKEEEEGERQGQEREKGRQEGKEKEEIVL